MQSRYNCEGRDRLYRFYMSDALKAIGGLDRRYADLVIPQKVEAREPQEIIQSIKDKIEEL